MDDDGIRRRLQTLEGEMRWLRCACAGIGILLIATVTGLGLEAQTSSSILRVRGLIVEDANGRARIVLGAPIEEGSDSIRTGLRLNDANGVERLGMTLRNNAVVLGLDAPPGTGDERNRERITLVADDKGGAALTFKDRRTFVGARMHLDEENRVWLQFSDFQKTPPVLRRLGLEADERAAAPR